MTALSDTDLTLVNIMFAFIQDSFARHNVFYSTTQKERNIAIDNLGY